MSKSLRKTTDSSRIGAGFGARAASIAIVGGGASGVAVAVNLMRNATTPLSIRVLEPRGGLGLGVAYSAAFDSHLLNVPAGDMSVFHDVPAHFFKWLRGNGHPRAEPTSFVPRRSYGAYLQSVPADALFQARPELTFEHVRSLATRISKNQG
ncbi:MAG TPA: FAD/NAD(P)-binding protein, partial [Candidatus Binataceae bacterium]